MDIKEKDTQINKSNQTQQTQQKHIENTNNNNSNSIPPTINFIQQKTSKLHLSNFINISQQNKFQHNKIFQLKFFKASYPWSLLPEIQGYINEFFKNSTPTINKGEIFGSLYLENKNILIQQGSILQHGCMIKSNTIIGKNCQIRSGAYIRGNTIIGDNCIIGHSCQIKIQQS